jgi:hypothetical protein
MSLAQAVREQARSNKISITNVVGYSYLIVSALHRSVYMRDRYTFRTQKIKEDFLPPACIVYPLRLNRRLQEWSFLS